MHEKRFEGDIDRLRNPERIARLEVDKVVNLCLNGIHVKSVLDVGTGTGLFAEAFAKRGLVVTGVDVNPRMVSTAHEYVPNGNFLEACAEELPFNNSSFDIVFMGLLLHESDEQLKVLNEARRIAGKQASILEWAYRQEEFGPPKEDRLSVKVLETLAEKAGFHKFEVIPLSKLIYYRLSN